MSMSRTATTFPPPVMEARRWIDGVAFPSNRPLMNVSQAAPVDPPPQMLREVMAEAALKNDDAHLYGPVLGLPELRAELAARTTAIYGGRVEADQVAITSGCNQAFAAVIAALCTEGDEVLLPTPWYFNHKMWLDMSGVTAVPLPTGPDMLPDVGRAERLITPRTRAIALVSPNNPAGVEYPPEQLEAFAQLARQRGIKLILDETYRDFHATAGAPHGLFSNVDWPDSLVHLYSFSKAYRLTGHRVGAIIAHPALLAEVEKFLDTVTICPNQIAQYAALAGLRGLDDWLAGEREEILKRRRAIESGFDVLAKKGWTLLGLGAYFAYLEHPFDMSSADLAPWLVREQSILCLPGTMFYPEGADEGKRHLRIAFANLDVNGIDALYGRLSAIKL